jgi:hypothetical protein
LDISSTKGAAASASMAKPMRASWNIETTASLPLAQMLAARFTSSLSDVFF